MRGKRILAVGVSVAALGGLAAAPALAADPDVAKRSERIASEWRLWNPGGAPVSGAFVQAALDEGLTAREVEAILESQALHGAQTGPAFSSPELLRHFTRHPELIPALLSAVESVADAPRSYAQYLEAGGTPGATYRSHGQLLQAAVLELSGARDAYLSGVVPLTLQERTQEQTQERAQTTFGGGIGSGFGQP